MSQQIVTQFIEAINSHNIESMGALMADDFISVDANNNPVSGVAPQVAWWNLYLFKLFPDFKIEAEDIFDRGEVWVVTGFSMGTYHHVTGEHGKGWRLPGAWKIVVKDEKIAVWQTYQDTFIPNQIVLENSPVTEYTDRINGLGGVFLKSPDPKRLCAWYDEHFNVGFGGKTYTVFRWCQRENRQHQGSTAFSIFKYDGTHFEPSVKQAIVNLRVNDLDALLIELKAKGVVVSSKADAYDFGKFGWAMDADGNKVELWEDTIGG